MSAPSPKAVSPLALALCAALLPSPVLAQEAEGYAEALVQGYLGVEGAPVTVVERVRPELSAALGERVFLASAVELTLVQGRNNTTELERMVDEADLTPTLDAIGYAWPSYENEALRVNGVDDYLSVQRLYLDLYLPKVDIRIGRQALNWGSAFMVNPTDPFPEVLLTEPWRNRSGVNAGRVTLPFGDLNQSQFVLASNNSFTDLRAANRTTVVLLNTDFSLVGAWNQSFEEDADFMDGADPLLGLDIRGTLGVGFWFEGAVHFDDEVYEELAVGLDYSFPVLESLILTAQYYRSGLDAEAMDPAEALADFGGDEDSAADPFAPFFTGENYVMAAVSLGIIPELAATVLHVQNIDDGTALLIPSLSAAPTDRIDLSLTAQLPLAVWGEGGELKPDPDDLLVSVPRIDGTEAQLDLGELLPAATLTLQTRFNF